MTPAQLAYVLSIGIAWVWALSQINLARKELGHWPPRWRVNVAQWMTVKAFFFTVLGVIAWEDIPHYGWLVAIFVVSHLFAFVQWVRLPTPAKTDAHYLKEQP